MSMIICLCALRIFSGFKPFVKESHDKFSEVSQWQVFFVMLSALMMKSNLDAGETSEDQGLYDVALVGIQFMSPLLLFLVLLRKSEPVARRFVNSISGGLGGRLEGAEGEGGGLELVERGEGGANQAAVLGGGSWPEPSNPRKSKFEYSNPLRDTPTTTTANKNKADTGQPAATILLKINSKGNVGPSRPNSSFDAFKNPNLTLGGNGRSNKNKNKIGKPPPKRKSKFAIPKEYLEDAPIGPPAVPPPSFVDSDDDDDDDVGPPPFPPPASSSTLPPSKPVCQWTEEWDTEHGTVYYLNFDGETSTWDMPEDFWRDKER
ncbi:hypothetical protein TrVE_jg14258 [Triparma verrucosa]|uniref:WW domain-containing protein n=1 Tax=Triparma verrucosa TaxID=1606542 RepID=A0A9W7BVF6_9STRA|nr:hypothetical protein TrVE_jg14258 [Triparma verrucosa]